MIRKLSFAAIFVAVFSATAAFAAQDLSCAKRCVDANISWSQCKIVCGFA